MKRKTFDQMRVFVDMRMVDRENGFKAMLFNEKKMIAKSLEGLKRGRDLEKANRRMQMRALKFFSLKYKKRYYIAIKEVTKWVQECRVVVIERNKILMRKYF